MTEGNDCAHVAASAGDPQRQGLRGVPEDRLPLAASAYLPDLWPRRLLRPSRRTGTPPSTSTPPATRSSRATIRRRAGAGAIDEVFLDLGEDTTPQVVRIRAYVGVGLRRPARAPAPGPPGPRPRALGGDGGGDDACPPRPSSHRRFAIERHDGRSPNNTTVAATSTTRSPFWVIVEELVRYPRPRAGRSSETRFERRRKRTPGNAFRDHRVVEPDARAAGLSTSSTATGQRSPIWVMAGYGRGCEASSANGRARQRRGRGIGSSSLAERLLFRRTRGRRALKAAPPSCRVNLLRQTTTGKAVCGIRARILQGGANPAPSDLIDDFTCPGVSSQHREFRFRSWLCRATSVRRR